MGALIILNLNDDVEARINGMYNFYEYILHVGIRTHIPKYLISEPDTVPGKHFEELSYKCLLNSSSYYTIELCSYKYIPEF
jgi:hypothetical protein